MACTNPSGGPHPAQRGDDLRAAFHRDVVHGQQEHAPGLEVQPVGHRPRGARACRPRRGVQPPARARHHVLVVLRHARGDRRGIDDLVRGSHPEIGGTGEVPAACARALREQQYRRVRVLAPGQVCAGRAGLLALGPFPAPAGLARRCRLAGQVISRWGHRGVPRVPRHRPLQARQPVLHLGDLGLKRGVPLRQHHDQLRLHRDQRITRSIHRPGSHRPQSSRHSRCDQPATPGRSDGPGWPARSRQLRAGHHLTGLVIGNHAGQRLAD